MGVTEVVFLIDDIDVGIMWEAWKVENRVGETSRVVWARGIGWGWEGSDEKSGFGDWYCKGREDNCEGPCNEIKSSQSWLPESFWLGTEERGVGNGWEMDLAGCTGVDLGDNAPGRVTFLAGTGGGGGEVLRLNGAGSVVGVDFGRVVTSLEYGRVGETNLEGLQFTNHLNSYLAAIRHQTYTDKFKEGSRTADELLNFAISFCLHHVGGWGVASFVRVVHGV